MIFKIKKGEMHTAFCSIRLCHVVTDLSFREMVVVHPDIQFLEDITGKLEEVCWTEACNR
jgi:hypothetical protein